MPKVLLGSPMIQRYQGNYREMLRKAGCDLLNPASGRIPTEAELIKLVPGVEAVIAGSEPYTAAVIEKADKLKIIARAGVGYDAVDIASASQRGIAVTIAPGSNHHAVADYTMALMLALCRKVIQFDRIVRDGRWDRTSAASPKEATLGIIGFGRVGQALAQRARGFEMRIVVTEPFPNLDLIHQMGVELVPLPLLLRQSDFVSLNCPLTEETRGIISAQNLAMMKPTAFLINTARGELVDEVALYDALKNRQLAGAGLDVFSQEPPPRNSLLRQLDNVIFAPHIAGVDDVSLHLMTKMAAEAIIEVLRGGWPERYAVNPQAKKNRRA